MTRKTATKGCAVMPPYKHSQDLVNAQVDINRAVWASNQRKATEVSGLFQTAEDRDEYIEACVRSAYKTLGKLISVSDNEHPIKNCVTCIAGPKLMEMEPCVSCTNFDKWTQFD